ncbi:MAG: DUF3043 domain-containing protein [Ornithinimicrobium sp.]|uniref:DUF3043 domain-containing protein n=1 Tax=Ornithinimicrobium sp. TaxID=1977084 RepID=UPI0026E0F3F3|nr:DUF3043 domain-containing protein [Ornithinimicrobium sp.]MDO5741075.1 DUF3043 domain-containing protein [Ornithinimicrobium sp.]
MQFWKKSSEPAELSEANIAASPPLGKGRPTPKRRDAEAANRRPLVGAAQNKTPEAKAKARSARSEIREAMLRGEERYLPERDKGPERRFLRDTVDSRRNVGEILLPAMLIVLALSVIQQDWAKMASFVGAYSLILFAIIDNWLLWRRAKANFLEAFGHLPGKGSASYTVLRAFQMRGSRIPRPALKRGDPVHRR